MISSFELRLLDRMAKASVYSSFIWGWLFKLSKYLASLSLFIYVDSLEIFFHYYFYTYKCVDLQTQICGLLTSSLSLKLIVILIYWLVVHLTELDNFRLLITYSFRMRKMKTMPSGKVNWFESALIDLFW